MKKLNRKHLTLIAITLFLLASCIPSKHISRQFERYAIYDVDLIEVQKRMKDTVYYPLHVHGLLQTDGKNATIKPYVPGREDIKVRLYDTPAPYFDESGTYIFQYKIKNSMIYGRDSGATYERVAYIVQKTSDSVTVRVDGGLELDASNVIILKFINLKPTK